MSFVQPVRSVAVLLILGIASIAAPAAAQEMPPMPNPARNTRC